MTHTVEKVLENNPFKDVNQSSTKHVPNVEKLNDVTDLTKCVAHTNSNNIG